jgi:hypothetical protein
VRIDTTPLDVPAILDDGVTGRAELTIAVDVASRTIRAAILRPAGTKAVDAALLLARMLVPEPMRPGWSDALRMSASLIPHARLMSADARLEHAAARPVIVPDTIIVDRGKVFVSDTFVAACRSLGMSFQPARPATPTYKGVVEPTFESINSMFCQHVAGYVGSDTTRRGRDVQVVWTISELADLFHEWVVALLPVEWRKINNYGITLVYRTYGCRELGSYRRQPSGVDTKGNLWEVHYDPYDLSHVWVRDTRAGGWITVPWTRLGTVSAPFADFTWRHARAVLAAKGADDTDDTDEDTIAVVIDARDCLTRWYIGFIRRSFSGMSLATRLLLRPVESFLALFRPSSDRDWPGYRHLHCESWSRASHHPDFSEDPTGPRSVDAFDDAEVALDAVGEGDQRLLVGRTLVRRDGLLEAVELDQDGALGDSGVMRHDPTATGEDPTAPGLDGRSGQLVVSSQLLRV